MCLVSFALKRPYTIIASLILNCLMVVGAALRMPAGSTANTSSLYQKRAQFDLEERHVAARQSAAEDLVALYNTIRRIMQSDLQVRLPMHRRADEIDAVSRDVNLMLDEIICLLVQIKGVAENIAHDLRTPLAMVRARLERGLANSDDRELRLAAAKALGQLDKAMITVAALLRIAEVESGPRPVGFAPIDLAAICADLFEFYEPLAREKSISTTLEAQSPVETIGDGDLMRGALSNLIDNAIKFTPGGGAHIGDDGRRLSGYSRRRQRGWG
jgi:signal transduction histidine kinase